MWSANIPFKKEKKKLANYRLLLENKADQKLEFQNSLCLDLGKYLSFLSCLSAIDPAAVVDLLSFWLNE